MSPLIASCLCGATRGFREFTAPTGLRVAECLTCGVIHQVTDTTPDAIAELYRGAYHASLDRHPGVIPYKDRYEHDRKVARIRLEKYRKVVPTTFGGGFQALDVGAANGAWVDELNAQGLSAIGVDPDPGMTRPTIQHGTVRDLLGDGMYGRFALLTYHDVLEHVVDPALELWEAAQLVRPGGVVVIDVPDVSVPAGYHHYKTEHLWFFTVDAVCQLLWRSGLRVHSMDVPVAGKFVVYGLAR